LEVREDRFCALGSRFSRGLMMPMLGANEVFDRLEAKYMAMNWDHL